MKLYNNIIKYINIFIGNIENRLENLNLSSTLFALEAALNQFRNLNFRVLPRVIYHIFE